MTTTSPGFAGTVVLMLLVVVVTRRTGDKAAPSVVWTPLGRRFSPSYPTSPTSAPCSFVFVIAQLSPGGAAVSTATPTTTTLPPSTSMMSTTTVTAVPGALLSNNGLVGRTFAVASARTTSTYRAMLQAGWQLLGDPSVSSGVITNDIADAFHEFESTVNTASERTEQPSFDTYTPSLFASPSFVSFNGYAVGMPYNNNSDPSVFWVLLGALVTQSTSSDALQTTTASTGTGAPVPTTATTAKATIVCALSTWSRSSNPVTCPRQGRIGLTTARLRGNGYSDYVGVYSRLQCSGQLTAVSNCTQCANASQQSPLDNCTSCANGADPAKACKACAGGSAVSLSSNCSLCDASPLLLPPACSQCGKGRNWLPPQCQQCVNDRLEMATGCTSCRNTSSLADPATQCTQCLNPLLNIAQGCNACTDPYRDPADQCQSCLSPKLDPAAQCRFCLDRRGDPATNCTTCRAQFVVAASLPSDMCDVCEYTFACAEQDRTCCRRVVIAGSCMISVGILTAIVFVSLSVYRCTVAARNEKGMMMASGDIPTMGRGGRPSSLPPTAEPTTGSRGGLIAPPRTITLGSTVDILYDEHEGTAARDVEMAAMPALEPRSEYSSERAQPQRRVNVDRQEAAVSVQVSEPCPPPGFVA